MGEVFDTVRCQLFLILIVCNHCAGENEKLAEYVNRTFTETCSRVRDETKNDFAVYDVLIEQLEKTLQLTNFDPEPGCPFSEIVSVEYLRNGKPTFAATSNLLCVAPTAT